MSRPFEAESAESVRVPVGCERIPLAVPGVHAFVTTRAAGSFGFGDAESAGVVMGRWATLEADLAVVGGERLASAHQVHGARVAGHNAGWTGWLRMQGVDGHFTTTPGSALAVTVADCTPVFIAHPRGAIASLHAGWRGTAAGILDVGLSMFEDAGYPADECALHLGPAICGACYEVGPEVLAEFRRDARYAGALPDASAGSARPAGKALLDVRAILQARAESRGVGSVTVSADCTLCHNDRFYSHRAGDSGRQLGVIMLRETAESS